MVHIFLEAKALGRRPLKGRISQLEDGYGMQALGAGPWYFGRSPPAV